MTEQQPYEAVEQLPGLVSVGVARFARFDPPFRPWFLRRNEVVQDVRWRDEA